MSDTSGPQIVFLRSLGEEHPLVTMWLCDMVDMGIDFAYGDDYQLLDTLPPEPGPIRIVVIQEDDWDAYHERLGDTLRAYGEAGVTVFNWRPLGDGETRVREAWVRMDIEMVLTEQNVTLDNPVARERLQRRGFWQLLNENRDYMARQMASSERKDYPWGDPHTCGVLEPSHKLAKLEPDAGWGERLVAHLDKVIIEKGGPPEYTAQHSAVSIITRLGLDLGRHDYLDFARRQVLHVIDNFPRLEGMPVNAKPGQASIPRTESMSFLLPPFAAVGAAFDDERILNEAFNVYDVVKRCCFEPSNGLWYHGGRTGWRCPVVWGRGTGWALMGLTGMLEWLSPDHPRFEEVRAMTEASFAALAEHQTEEGMWRNVIDHPLSRPDMSATSLTTRCLADCLRHKWVSGALFEEMLEKSWRASRGRIFRDRGCTTTEGTSVGSTLQFYMSRLHHNCGASYALHAGAAYELWRRSRGA